MGASFQFKPVIFSIVESEQFSQTKLKPTLLNAATYQSDGDL